MSGIYSAIAFCSPQIQDQIEVNECLSLRSSQISVSIEKHSTLSALKQGPMQQLFLPAQKDLA